MEDCLICHKSIGDINVCSSTTTTICKHKFHTNCLTRSGHKTGTKCPICMRNENVVLQIIGWIAGGKEPNKKVKVNHRRQQTG